MLKKLSVVPLLIFVTVNIVFAFSGGDGSLQSPYQISNLTDITTLMNNSSYWTDNYVVTNDIDITGLAFKPIGNYSNDFSGSFDGGGYNIVGMKVVSTSYSYVGFFGVIGENGVVQNVNFVSSNVSVNYSSWLYAGVVAGINKGFISDCSIDGRVVASSQTTYSGLVAGYNTVTGYVGYCAVNGNLTTSYCGGGIIGYNSGAVSDCYINGNVVVNKASSSLNASGWAGGITGIAAEDSIIIHSSSSGIVSININEPAMQVSLRAGGIAGTSKSNAIIDLCSSSSDILATATGAPAESYSGGLVGRNEQSIISKSFASGNVEASSQANNNSASAYAGGALGSNLGSVSNCYASGDADAYSVGSPNNAFSGGFCGRQSENGYISKSYSTGIATSTQNKGAFLGELVSGQILASFWNWQTTGFDPDIHSGIGKNSGGSFELYAVDDSQMQLASTFSSVGWDMTDVWYMGVVTGYPEITGVMLPVSVKSDLTVLSSSSDKTVIASNEVINITASIKNVGSTITPTYFVVSVYGSEASGVDWDSLGDEAVLASVSCLPLSVESVVEKILEVSIPDDASVYYLRVKVDTFNSIDEVDETNNWGEILSVETLAYADGSGTVADPYVIETSEEFNSIGARQGDWDASFVLAADIDMSGVDFNIIGINGQAGFGGNFDGAGHTISNIVIDDSEITEYAGVFGSLDEGAQVTGLGIVDITINTPNAYYVGPIAGWCDGVISECFATGEVSGEFIVGGICGGLSGVGATVTDCYSMVDVAALNFPAGITAYALTQTMIKNCYFAGTLNSGGYSGGVTSFSDGATVENCYFDLDRAGTLWTDQGEGVSTDWLTIEDNLSGNGWDYISTWHQVEGQYPVLKWQELIILADFTGDSMVDDADIIILAQQWLDSGENLQCDIKPLGGDGIVNLIDFAFFADAWLR